MYAILCTDGQVDYKAVINECRPEKWVPIFSYYETKNPKTPIIPIFHDPETARKFTKRNLPKDWVKGAVFLIPENIDWMKEKNWKINIMQFPRLMKNLPNVKIGFEIMEFIKVPGVVVG